MDGPDYPPESWGVEYIVIPGDPAKLETWQQLDYLLAGEWKTEDGRALRLGAVCIDSGGHHTAQVYAFCEAREWFLPSGRWTGSCATRRSRRRWTRGSRWRRWRNGSRPACIPCGGLGGSGCEGESGLGAFRGRGPGKPPAEWLIWSLQAVT